MLTLPNYQIGTAIYESANSVVYRGHRKKDNQPIILKMLKEDYPTPLALSRYRQEYEITHDLDLAGVIKVYGIEKYQNTLVIILEDFGGESLKTTLEKGEQGGISVTDFLPLAIQIADSLGNIHAANIIHKDINSANIVWNKKINQLKIIDFSIASRLPRENPSLKNPEQLEGTLAYISPEQTGRMNRALDYRTDLYSLGVTFYELLTGKVPFESDSALELVHCHIAKTPVPVCEVNSNVPPIISDIVMKLMAKNVEDRYQSAFGVKADLEKCQKNLTGLQYLSGLQFELAQNDFSGKLQIPQKLYGRENEIKMLLQAFERVSEGATEMMLVAGYSGVGKTALVQEVHKPMTSRNGYFASGKFDQFQKNIPYSALTQAFNGFCRYLLMESADTLQHWQTKILDAVGNNGQIIIDIIPDLELVIGKQSPVAEVGATEAQNRFHLVFQNFFRAICQKEHPFVLFIDDLQWADSASLNLLNTLMTDIESQYFLIIGAYRDNEVDATHPLIMFVETMQKEGSLINTISLSNLTKTDVSVLMTDSLGSQIDDARSLTQLVYDKTQGNAFFTHEFLKSLYEQNFLTFNLKTQEWQWDINKIQTLSMTDNVVELMVSKISQLPPNTIETLKLAACIGNSFDLKTLSLIVQQSPSDTLALMWITIEEGLVLSLKENQLLENPEKEEIAYHFKFQHDRVQQAAYSLIDEADRQLHHLVIGRFLLTHTKEEELEEQLFKIVNQLNNGLPFIIKEAEKIQTAKLNLQAAQKAKAATAYKPAFDYLKIGLTLLGHQAWQQYYDLSLALHTEAAETAYLKGDFAQAESLLEQIKQQANTVLEQIKTDDLQIQMLIAQNQMNPALKIGISILEQRLGIFLTNSQSSNWTMDDFTTLPTMNAPNSLMAMRILMRMCVPALMTEPAQLPNIIFTMLRLTLTEGYSPLSAFAYAWYSLLLCGDAKDIEAGYQFGRLALQKANESDDPEIKCKVMDMFAAFILHWKKHAKKTLDIYPSVIQIGLEHGILDFCGYASLGLCQNVYWVGEPLESLQTKQKKWLGLLENLRREFEIQTARVLVQLTQCLTGQSPIPQKLTGDFFDEAKMIPLLEKTHNQHSLFYVYLAKTILSYTFRDLKSALNSAEHSKNYVHSMAGLLVVAIECFYDSLTLLAFDTSSESEKSKVLEKVSANQQQMKQWSIHAPMNFQHKYDLVEAEKARVLGKNWEAAELYEKAIAGARENEYFQEEALAYELTAEFYLARGIMDKIAQTYMKEAHYRYQQWGAIAKVKDLEERYPQWLVIESVSVMPTMFTSTPTSTILASTRTRTSSSQWLDLESVMKAAQTLSGEIVLSQLLSKMMRIVIENAGAQRGFLLLPHESNKWVIEAEGAIDKAEVTVLHSLPVENHLPEAIISYVARTHENVVLADARREGLYTENPYIKAHQTQSVLCFPIVYQQQLRAILYFENNLSTGAFTSQRLSVLQMLSSQIAISLENAQVMAHLDIKVKERTAQLNTKIEELTQTRQELVQSEKMASLGRLVAGFAHELNTPLGVALSSATLLQREATKINQFMEQDEVDEDDLLSVLDSIDKAANLNVSNLKRAANLVTSFKRTAVDQTSDTVRSFQVQQLIQDTITTLHSRFKKTKIEISMDCPKDFKVKSLPGALEQILTNLLMNSLIHGFDEGKNAGSISIKAQLDGDNLHLEYSDNGKGIASENLEKIFEPFFTTHRAHGGSGLGMYICYNIVTTQLQGTITCESVLGEGVMFKIDYPI
ncbi:MAG: ATP-binding sensor histidine kinase [Candidatus Parabeggiatoa sp.]|nr:ATP-binding sensor histidine kinase [Candidatus Parabeggiatoa sp.]